jgi:transposase
MFIMETMGRKQRRRRSFTPEFKAEIVERCRAGDRTIGQVAKDFDLTETAVRAWVNQAETDAGERPGLTSDERAELARLRRENRSLREDVEVLKRATTFLPQRQDHECPAGFAPDLAAHKAEGTSHSPARGSHGG